MIYHTTRPTFEYYFRPKTIEEAVSLLASYGKEARLLAGGTDLVPLMRNRAVMPKYVIDITEIPELDYVRVDKTGTLKIGALATIKAVEQSKTVKEEYPLLYEATHRLGTTQLRNMATVVGNICRASPSADTAPPLLALDASVEIVGPDGTKIVPLDGFFTGPGETILDATEMVTEVRVPKPPIGTGTAFLKSTRVADDLAKVNAASVLTVQNGVCKDVRLALGGVAPTPVRAKKAEQILRDNKLEDELIEVAATTAADETNPITDLRSTDEYRKELSKVLVRRVIKISWKRAQGRKGG